MENPKYRLYGIQVSNVYGSPYARGNFGSAIREYGYSKQAMKRFVKRPVEVPVVQPEAKIAVDSVIPEPSAPEPVSEPSTT